MERFKGTPDQNRVVMESFRGGSNQSLITPDPVMRPSIVYDGETITMSVPVVIAGEFCHVVKFELEPYELGHLTSQAGRVLAGVLSYKEI